MTTKAQLATEYARLIVEAVEEETAQGHTKSASYTPKKVQRVLVDLGTQVENLSYINGRDFTEEEKGEFTQMVAELLGVPPKNLRVLFKSGSVNALQQVNQQVIDAIRAIQARSGGK